MANFFTRLFSRNKEEDKEKIEEKVTSPSQTDKNNEVIDNLYSSQTTVLKGIDVSNEEEEKLINLYKQMENDAIISAALDLYADSATQINPKTGHVVAVESANETFEKEINEFLWRKVKIDTEAWQLLRDTARDGKLFLDTMVDEEDWSFVPVQNPANIKALTKGQDNIRYFVVSPESDQEEDDYSFTRIYRTQDKTLEEYSVVPKDRYIAGFSSREIRGTMTLQKDTKYLDDPIEEEYTIRSGRSLLANVVQTFQTLSALEDALFMNRLTKSTQFKIVSVDVGENTSNKHAKQIIDAVKNAFKSSETIDQKTERYYNRQSPIPVNDFIYVPTKGAKGSVTLDTIGGENVEAKTDDIDYYRNKLFAGLGVLKAYLGFEETTPGGLGDSTLTKLDERYGKRVIRLQQVLVHIVKQMIEFYWKYSATSSSRTVDNMPEYTIVLGKVSTKEEEEKTERLKDSLDIAERIISLTKDEDFVDLVDKEKLFEYIFSDVIGLDTNKFKYQASPEDIDLKVKQIKKIDEKVKPRRKNPAYSDNSEDILRDIKEEDMRKFFEENSLFVETSNDTLPFRIALNLSRYNRKLLKEKTYTQLKDMSKSKDPERLKKSKRLTATYTGIDDDNNVTFQITAEDPQKNKEEGRPTSYQTKVALKDLAYLLKAVKEEEGEITDKDIVLLAMQGDVSVSCECPAAKYWGQQYVGTKKDYSLDKNKVAPTKNIPTQPLCKHTITTLTVLPFWWNTIIRDLRKKGVLPSSEELNKKIDDKAEEMDEEPDEEEQE